MNTRVLGVVLTAGLATALTSTATAPAASSAPAVPPADYNGHVQLNDDTAVTSGQTNRYLPGEFNVALGGCLAPGATAGGAPHSTTFSSPVLTFSEYTYEQAVGAPANVTATASLRSGTAPGSYPIVLSCNGKTYSAMFTVPASTGSGPQRSHPVPAGAPETGAGGTARWFGVSLGVSLTGGPSSG